MICVTCLLLIHGMCLGGAGGVVCPLFSMQNKIAHVWKYKISYCNVWVICKCKCTGVHLPVHYIVNCILQNVKMTLHSTGLGHQMPYWGVQLPVHCIVNCILQNVKMTWYSTGLGRQMPLPGGTSAFLNTLCALYFASQRYFLRKTNNITHTTTMTTTPSNCEGPSRAVGEPRRNFVRCAESIIFLKNRRYLIYCAFLNKNLASGYVYNMCFPFFGIMLNIYCHYRNRVIFLL